MGAKPSCEVCRSIGCDYDNPLITFTHIGKYHNRVYCINCLRDIIIYKNKLDIHT